MQAKRWARCRPRTVAARWLRTCPMTQKTGDARSPVAIQLGRFFICYGEVCFGSAQKPANLMACFVTASSASTESPLAAAPPMRCDLQSYTGTPPAKATTPKCRLPQVYPFSRSVYRNRLVAHTPQRVAGPALPPVVLPKVPGPLSSILEVSPTPLLSTATSFIAKGGRPSFGDGDQLA